MLSVSSELLKPDAEEVQFLRWPLEAGSESKLVPTEPHVKMHKFTAEMNMFTARDKKEVLVFVANFIVDENYHYKLCKYAFFFCGLCVSFKYGHDQLKKKKKKTDGNGSNAKLFRIIDHKPMHH